MVSGDIHAIEIGIAVEAFDLFDLELKLLPSGSLSWGVAVTETCLKDTASKAISRVNKTRSLVNGSKGDAPLFEARGQYVVPLFPGERMGANNQKGITYVFFALFFFLKFLGFLPAVIDLKCLIYRIGLCASKKKFIDS